MKINYLNFIFGYIFNLFLCVIKILNFVSEQEAKGWVWNLKKYFQKYAIEAGDCELMVMHRHWLNLSDLTTDLGTIAQRIDSGIVKELYKKESQDLTIQKKIRLEIGRYNSILMDNYGEAIVENGHVVGYKIFKDEGVVVKDVIDGNGG